MAKKKFDGRSASEGQTLLLAPDTITAASVGGTEYSVENDGSIEIPTEHVPELLVHGFRLPPTAR